MVGCGFSAAWAQAAPPPVNPDIYIPTNSGDPPPELIPPEELSLPESPAESPALPAPELLVPAPSPLDRVVPARRGGTVIPEPTFYVESFQLIGSTVFTDADFAAVFAEYRDREITFSQLSNIAAAITQRYIDQGYLTSNAFIPPQTVEAGTVTIQVTEGTLEDIVITGTTHLEPAYILSRLRLVASPPLNVKALLAALQKLQRDPVIETIAANLQAGTEPGSSLLQVTVTEADPVEVTVNLDNQRSPNVGSFRRQLAASDINLTGLGDRISLTYARTDGSGSLDFRYAVPLSPYNTRLQLAAGISESHVIADEFENFEINADGFYTELEVSQPLLSRLTQELRLELALTHQQSQLSLGDGSSLLGLGLEESEILPLLSPGANANGTTRVTALRFAQTWSRRQPNQVMAVRSQFSLGIGLFDASRSAAAPDSQFLAWRGQAQWVRRLAPDLLVFLRGSAQLASTDLLAIEQFSLGGQSTLRGYRQDALLRDNGLLLSAEVRLPILRIETIDGRLQVTPFVDLGTAWNYRDRADTLVGVGLGLLWQQGDNFSARLDWGLPLIDDDNSGDRLQDNGFYFSVRYTPF
ncbi:ShlB/FhaC/HecB family hemolysin secretion/activation protein [Romeria aff. gracilis LEGE 07310]|uniref:ShlB/FhaC/HecB family hemolysin secretion/activation protein n=1 Tax=Vasconcelosia minhoensis LEGE 07310 TaxID=915328 RepID=A0A8J7DBR7_9CYAN|nr:ShlB/FhaC/HecB family hemolysin secretion/activation protein [Romeria aff. gracilis LEGE 07310]